MTCVASSIFSDDHLHFLDGGDGGYSRAADQLDRASARAGRRAVATGMTAFL